MKLRTIYKKWKLFIKNKKVPFFTLKLNLKQKYKYQRDKCMNKSRFRTSYLLLNVSIVLLMLKFHNWHGFCWKKTVFRLLYCLVDLTVLHLSFDTTMNAFVSELSLFCQTKVFVCMRVYVWVRLIPTLLTVHKYWIWFCCWYCKHDLCIA